MLFTSSSIALTSSAALGVSELVGRTNNREEAYGRSEEKERGGGKKEERETAMETERFLERNTNLHVVVEGFALNEVVAGGETKKQLISA